MRRPFSPSPDVDTSAEFRIVSLIELTYYSNRMHIHEPQEISILEWKEIMRFPLVRDVWGIEENEAPEQFASMVYAVKFRFASGSPGYVGDLYILQGATLSGEPPIVLVRENGMLKSAV